MSDHDPMSEQRTPASRRPGLIGIMIIAGVPLVGLAGYLGYAVGQHVAPQHVAAAHRPAPATPAPARPVATTPPARPRTCSVTLAGSHPRHYAMRDGQLLTTPSAQILCANGTIYTETRAPAPSPRPAAAAATDTVKPGDTLWGIARKVYSNPQQWHRLYGLNRNVIGTNPDLIYSGTVLRLR
jgi:nucleoid-associated protein YgaU